MYLPRRLPPTISSNFYGSHGSSSTEYKGDYFQGGHRRAVEQKDLAIEISPIQLVMSF